MSFVLALGAFILIVMWLLFSAPLGEKTVSRTIRINAPTERLWNALFPFGSSFGWNEAVSAVIADGDRAGWIVTRHDGRDGMPIRRRFELSEFVDGQSFRLRYTDDTALAAPFWDHFFHDVSMQSNEDGSTRVTIAETDRYHGAAFLIFRYFALRRMARKLAVWSETGTYLPGGIFEKPVTQFAMAGLSILLLWPIFGLTLDGFVLSVTLTLVVALHELGHMAAFRLSGHKSARMIFLPLLGGIALGSRPYDKHFEIAFSALMGAGFSVFVVWIVAFAHMIFGHSSGGLSEALLIFVVLCGLFNLANLLPIKRFDGGQVLRQVFRHTLGLMIASAATLGLFIWAGVTAGIALPYMLGVGAVILMMSLLTGRQGVKPARPLTPMNAFERVAIVAGLAAVVCAHAIAAVWAWNIIQA